MFLHLVELGDVLAVDADETLQVWLGVRVGSGEISVDRLDCPGWVGDGGDQDQQGDHVGLLGDRVEHSHWSRSVQILGSHWWNLTMLAPGSMS